MNILIPDGVYQELTRRAIKDKDLGAASYLLILSAAKEVACAAPQSIEELEEKDLFERVVTALDSLALAINATMPEGIYQFASHLQDARRAERAKTMPQVRQPALTPERAKSLRYLLEKKISGEQAGE